ncbi:deoxyribodipyrimidine photo-lyase, 8-HDF type [Fischerella thermalis]|jgi:deoxyribodipyrimidine photo-lyase|uniref:Deoxyribodipyrimidine photo-lyase, 8-HDF type n=1 Tax=Fischerella thermalis JSC-11 TaxID=741277 RepID=G6FYU9_9CYAN|nr:deoxyribodipyrimidine photo-lyase, 8-HDF type [Fischerella thermalis]PMB04636.1 deoxyribodipyrimidine photo-lyase [Fischerella thermalis CCMEE 5273]PMB12391.1 deoxyribodipyrimidine photo-lyase [Fischerella thermalis CCMEE 5328]EHC09411.1 deoxyribodipyrimidine photo-lyase, 8-HDF type [Fischerella thermalis JSC-11]MBF1988592.1 deoxyribodipyrimidine photo-lyase, 8-HDF type [Fischerella thermalis M58_A2018_009]MBF2059148.1 deoxyribodipyrimidine photo-lyase, 8-HDF type [Fischerella thermalis M66
MSDLILFWHRRDLRISDNTGLATARQRSAKVVGVFCLDPNILERDDVAPVRVTYMIGCLQALQKRYAQAGSQLLILHAHPTQAIPALAVALGAKAVFWNWDVEPYSQERDRTIISALKEKGIEFLENNWDQVLHAPEDIRTGSNQPYTVYTPFWKNWISKPKAEPVATLENAEGLTEKEKEIAKSAGVIALPSAKDLGFVWDGELIIAPGEQAAQERLEEFCDRAINEYQEQRNFPAVDGTSRLSAALKFGAIGIRRVWQATQQVWENSRSEETQSNIRTWQQELAWREFYQHAMYNFPELAAGAYRDAFKNFPWEINHEHFQAWCEGKTGYPIVDAAMRQMNEIGWMHNRCRMIVASFLTKDLLINPQMGERYFMQKLIDGDLSANNGGWQWSASSGMDPKPVRIFNPASQAQKFDPEAEYIRQWVPELRSFDTEYLVTGKITPLERQAVGYPAPIVDHKLQQKMFKERYQQQKVQPLG